MPWRFRIYGWFMDRPGVVLRWLVVNALVIFLVGLMMALLDTKLWGNLEQRWGLTVWFSFVVGFSGVAVFNIILGLMGLGYSQWRDRREERPAEQYNGGQAVGHRLR